MDGDGDDVGKGFRYYGGDNARLWHRVVYLIVTNVLEEPGVTAWYIIHNHSKLQSMRYWQRVKWVTNKQTANLTNDRTAHSQKYCTRACWSKPSCFEQNHLQKYITKIYFIPWRKPTRIFQTSVSRHLNPLHKNFKVKHIHNRGKTIQNNNDRNKMAAKANKQTHNTYIHLLQIVYELGGGGGKKIF